IACESRAERGCSLSNGAVLVTPLRRAALVHRFLEIQNQLVRGAECVAFARRVFPEEIAIVFCGQIPMVRARQIVDLSETLGKGASGCHRNPLRGWRPSPHISPASSAPCENSCRG